MLNIIDTILYEHELPLLQGIDKEILGALEKAGMKPPLTEKAVDSFGSKYNGWDLEDEKLEAALKNTDELPDEYFGKEKINIGDMRFHNSEDEIDSIADKNWRERYGKDE